MVQKIPIISKNASNESCAALNFLQKTQGSKDLACDFIRSFIWKGTDTSLFNCFILICFQLLLQLLTFINPIKYLVFVKDVHIYTGILT